VYAPSQVGKRAINWARHFAPALILCFFFGFCLTLVQDYGSGQDEGVQMRFYQAQLEKWRMSSSISDIKDTDYYYGMLFEAFSYYLTPNIHFPHLTAEGSAYVSKHYVTLLFCFLGYVGLYIALRQWCGVIAAMMLSIATLGLNPHYFMHSFIDPKDAPYAAILTFSCVMCALCLTRLHEHIPHSAQWRHFRTCIYYAAGIGLWIGLAASLRAAGVILLAYAGMAWLMTADWRALRRVEISWLLLLLIMLALTAAVVLFSVIAFTTPVARLDPLGWTFRAVMLVIDFTRWSGCTMMEGRCVDVIQMTHDYLITWVMAQTPIATLILAPGGIIIFFLRWRELPVRTRLVSIMLFLQVFLLPLYLSLARTRLYNGGRHFMFMGPAMSFFSAVCILQLWRWRSAWACRIPVLALVTFLYGRVALDMIELHPYEQAYLNELVRRNQIIGRNWYIQLPTVIYKELHSWARENLGDDIVYNPHSNTLGRYEENDEACFYQAPKMIQMPLSKLSEHPEMYLLVDYHLGAINEQAYVGCESKYKVTRWLGAQSLRIGEIWDCMQHELNKN